MSISKEKSWNFPAIYTVMPRTVHTRGLQLALCAQLTPVETKYFLTELEHLPEDVAFEFLDEIFPQNKHGEGRGR